MFGNDFNDFGFDNLDQPDYNQYNQDQFDYTQFDYGQFASSQFDYTQYGYNVNDFNQFKDQYYMLNSEQEYINMGIPLIYLPLFYAMLNERGQAPEQMTSEQEDKAALGYLLSLILLGIFAFGIFFSFNFIN